MNNQINKAISIIIEKIGKNEREREVIGGLTYSIEKNHAYIELMAVTTVMKG